MSHHFSFDFYLRLDDDYFLCLERLLTELTCLLEPGTQQPPIYAGFLRCREAPNIDEAYILFSSIVVQRVLATSGLQCTGYGSFTAAAWLGVGGPGDRRRLGTRSEVGPRGRLVDAESHRIRV